MTTKYDSKLDTIDHIKVVQELLNEFSDKLKTRAIAHDSSKLTEPEKLMFDIYVPKLKQCVYGSDEYKENLANMGDALRHHYDKNSHHPEHYEDGIDGMDLLDVIEMFCDWKAATKRMKDGDINKSIEINADRFGINDQLKSILVNTIMG